MPAPAVALGACVATGITAALAGPAMAATASPGAGTVSAVAAGVVGALPGIGLGLTGGAETGRARSPLPVREFVVSSLRSSGPRTLRAAIHAVNTGPRASVATITFAVHGVIRLERALPAITRHAIIDGTSAPTYASGGPPVVEIDCHGKAGLVFAPGSKGSQLLAIAVDNASGDGVTLRAGVITLNADYIGLDLTGAEFGNRGNGVYAGPTSDRNVIGLNTSGDSGVVANVISGNGKSGLVLAGSPGNTVVANRIGTNPAGTAAIPNGADGLKIIKGSNGNEIGGTEFTDAATGQSNNPTGDKGTVPPVFVVPPLGNLISGNVANGVVIGSGSAGNVLNGNFVGTTADGNAALGNGGNGVWINQANRNSLIGCTFTTNPFVYYNVLSSNGANGLLINNSDNVVVQGNFFGAGADNSTALGNRLNGIKIAGTSQNTQVGGVIPLGNVSAGNGLNGISVTGQVRGFVTFNTFGGLYAFGAAAPNGRDGLLVTSTGGDNLARTNVFSGNAGNGIELSGDARGVTVDPDIVGMNTKGEAPLPNGGNGVLIDGNAHANIIGGTRRSVIRQNTFSGNDGHGLVITGTAHGNRVFNSYIGTLILGNDAAGNGKGGVLVSGSAYHNAIGQPGRRPSNLISGNTGNGVTLLLNTHGNAVFRNFVGLSLLRKCLPNTGRQIVNRGHHNLIRGNRICPAT